VVQKSVLVQVVCIIFGWCDQWISNTVSEGYFWVLKRQGIGVQVARWTLKHDQVSEILFDVSKAKNIGPLIQRRRG
jgi:hypothetical protein